MEVNVYNGDRTLARGTLVYTLSIGSVYNSPTDQLTKQNNKLSNLVSIE